jgi:hypothetical protein
MYKMAKKPGHEVAFGQMYTRIITACTFAGLTLLIFQDEVLAVLSSKEFAGAERAIPILVFAHFLLAFCYLLDSAGCGDNRRDVDCLRDHDP